MPLPTDGNTAWPPKRFDMVAQAMNEHATWWGGDPSKLSELYGGLAQSGDRRGRSILTNRPSQYRGGLQGWIARLFWGRPIPTGELRSKLHIPLASDIATTSADLIFAEPPKISLDDTAAQRRLDDLTDLGMLHATLVEAAEVQSPLGGVYVATTWDDRVVGFPWLRAVHADAVVPEFVWGRLRAATLWRIVAAEGQTVWRHLERHEPGVILHGLFRGSYEVLGQRLPLRGHPATADLPDQVEGIPGRLTVDYVPNMRPNRIERGSEYAPLGRSDYSPGGLTIMDALDETWSSWMRDVRLAKARLLVPEQYLQNNGPGEGATFDEEREIYSTLQMLTRPGEGQSITQSQFAIRVAEHRDTAHELVTNAVRSCGYSEQSFGLADGVAMTATEVEARERRSMITRSKKVLYWRYGLREAITTLLLVDQQKFGGVGPGGQPPKVEFPPGVQDTLATVAQTLQLLAAAEAASTETKVRLAHPDWDDDQVRAEVRQIREDVTISAVGHDPGAEPPPPAAAPGGGGQSAEPFTPAGSAP